MNPETYRRINAILEEIIDLTEEERDREIRDRCTGDPELEREIRRMLDNDRAFEHDLVLGDDAINSSRAELDALLDADEHHALPDSIGEFTVIREIGRGGMGVVYECQQQNPRRRVAVKVVESVLRATDLRRRLAAESQIQGQLQHPGIARVYQAGFADFGRSRCPYFVMEFVDGRPLHVHVDTNKLDHRAKVELMVKIAQGMNHAHERGIIHRDLKPENILVQEDGQPKVLDFGIARLVNDSTLAATTMTREGQILGTLAYMAPEQLSGKPDQTGARSDVFALGAIMYDLFVGHPPFRVEGMSLSAAFRAIELDEPTPIRMLNKGVDKDLETIVMRCLRREPERRFANAGELSDELVRYLTAQLIRSRPPTIRYRSKQFVKRNKLLVTGVSTTMLALFAGLIFTLYFAQGQHTARLRAEHEATRARSKETEAIRGVLAGVQILNDRGERWDSVNQLGTIAEESRGWEWKHIALKLPWVQYTNAVRQTKDPESAYFTPIVFLDPSTLVEYERSNNRFWLNNIVRGERSGIEHPPLDHDKSPTYAAYDDGNICLQLDDGTLAVLDLRSATLEPIAGAKPITNAKLRAYFHDEEIAVYLDRSRLHVIKGNQQVFEIGSGYDDHSGMHWNAPVLDRVHGTLFLSCWNNQGEIIAVDIETWTVRNRASVNAIGPTPVLSPDSSVLYTNSRTGGIQKYSTADLSYLGTIDPNTGTTTLVRISPDGKTLVANYFDHHELRFYDTTTEERIRTENIGADHLSWMSFSPESSILLGHTPNDFWNWYIDLESPDDESITPLMGHQSWVYQLAISPDGSLFASAEPETGTVLLWDLPGERVIARFERPRYRGSHLMESMNAPLVFDPSGSSLSFAERNVDSNERGMTTIDLASGDRSWMQTGSHEATLDAAADIIGHGQIHHHAAALTQSRILQTNASIADNDPVLVRGRARSSIPNHVITDHTNAITSGLALSPDADVFAVGEYLTVRIYDAQTYDLLSELPDASATKVYGMTYSPDGSRFAMGTEEGTVLIFDTEFYTRLATIKVPPTNPSRERNYVYNLAWTPDFERLVVVGGSDLRVLETKRARARADDRFRWESELDRARSGDTSVSGAASLIARIERWSDTTNPHP
jgi:serine/threonine protein kinase/DNA-binding beta-propeller fold protein YncE